MPEIVMTEKFAMRKVQKLSLSLVGLILGEVVAVLAFSAVFVARNAHAYQVMIHNWRYVAALLYYANGLEALLSAIAWFLFTLPLILFWDARKMLANSGLAYLLSLFAGAVGVLCFAATALYGEWKHKLPLTLHGLPPVAMVVTASFSILVSAVSMRVYLQLLSKALAAQEAPLASLPPELAASSTDLDEIESPLE